MNNLSLFILFRILVNYCFGLPANQPAIHGTRIIGGENAPEGFAPHMVALIAGEFWKHVFCGGSIITRSHVLTAAHCVDIYSHNGMLACSFHGLVGSNQWNSGGKEVHFSSYQNHPDWDPINIKHDASVLTLRDRLDLNERVAIIRLNFDWIDDNVGSYVTGWGNTGPKLEDDILQLAPTPDDLQLLFVNTISPNACIIGVQQMADKWQMPTVPPVVPDIEICTFHSKGHGMCNGDSGSALVLQETGEQIGIVAWGFPCAVGAPDVYTRISGVKDFLEPFIRPI